MTYKFITKGEEMEYYEVPYTQEQLSTEGFQENKQFLKDLEQRVLGHRVFDHPFLVKFASGTYNQEGTKYIMKQFFNIVMPFTAAISKLMGNAPDIQSRFMLMDNLYEELGNIQFNQSHPLLYLQMMESVGVTKEEFEKTPTLSSIRVLNNTIFDAVENKPFDIGCAWLGYGGELTIPNNFPYLVKGIYQAAFKEMHMAFWDRHGERDQEHSDDATTVLCMNTSPDSYTELEAAVLDSLNLRAYVWDELEAVCDQKYTKLSKIHGRETGELSKEYQALHEYYKALSSKDIDLMEKNWSKEENIAFTNPLGGIIKGRDAVIEAHATLFKMPIHIDVEYYDIEITPLSNGFSSVGRERGTMTIGDECINVDFRTSRLYVKEDDGYRQLHHHGSFEDIVVQEKILQVLQKSAG